MRLCAAIRHSSSLKPYGRPDAPVNASVIVREAVMRAL